MTKYTQKQLRAMVNDGIAENITNADNNVREELEKKEGWLRQIGYSAGVYGCNGMLFQGRNSGTLYAITARTNAVFIFG